MRNQTRKNRSREKTSDNWINCFLNFQNLRHLSSTESNCSIKLSERLTRWCNWTKVFESSLKFASHSICHQRDLIRFKIASIVRGTCSKIDWITLLAAFLPTLTGKIRPAKTEDSEKENFEEFKIWHHSLHFDSYSVLIIQLVLILPFWVGCAKVATRILVGFLTVTKHASHENSFGV